MLLSQRRRAVAFLSVLARVGGPAGALLALFASLAAPGCGARTGLRQGTHDAGVDGALDAAFDVGVDVPPECVADADCDSGDHCAPRVCVEGRCQDAPPVVCDDGDECTSDSCATDTGQCTFAPLSLDQDGDGYKGPRPGFVPGAPGSCGDDCDDTSAAAHPGGKEICDGVDNDCNGIIDDDARYAPQGKDAVLVPTAKFKQSGAGGVVYNGELYAASYAGQSKHWQGYTKGLTATGGAAFPETPVTSTDNDTFAGPIVWTGAIFGVVWEDRRAGNYEIFFNRLGADGKKLMKDVQVTHAGSFSLHPEMIWNGTEFLVLWDDSRAGGTAVYGQRISVDGVLHADGNQLMGPGESPRMAEGDQGLGVVFYTGDSLRHFVRFQAFDETFVATGSPAILGDGTATEPSIAWSGDRYVVAWSTRTDKPGDSIWGAALAEDGSVLVPATRLTTGATFARSQWLLPLGDRLVMLWADDKDGSTDGNFELYSEMLSTELKVISPRARITKNSSDTLGPIAAFGPDGDIGVLFDDRRSGSWQAYFTRLTCVAGN